MTRQENAAARMAYDLALAANDNAIVAITKIESHEAECGRRWAIMVRLMFGSLGVLLSILGTLIYERIAG